MDMVIVCTSAKKKKTKKKKDTAYYSVILKHIVTCPGRCRIVCCVTRAVFRSASSCATLLRNVPHAVAACRIGVAAPWRVQVLIWWPLQHTTIICSSPLTAVAAWFRRLEQIHAQPFSAQHNDAKCWRLH